MDSHKIGTDPPEPPAGAPRQPPARQVPEGCLVVAIRLPARVVALVLVLPLRMAWDALVAGGRLLTRTVLRPAGRASLWIARALLVWPFVGLWRYVVDPLGRALSRLGRVLVAVPLGCLHRYVLTPLGHALIWLYARVLTPVGHGLWWALRGAGAGLAAAGAGVAAGVAWLVRHLVVVPARWLHEWVLTPVGRAIAWCAAGLLRGLRLAVTGAGVCLCRVLRVLLVPPALVLWRWVLVPAGRLLAVTGREAGQALGHAWRVAGRVSLAVGRALGALLRWIFVEPVRWLHRSVLTPVGQAVRDTVLRPAAEAARGAGRAVRSALAAARESVRQARADVRRVLFGARPEPVEAVDRREPVGRAARTLGRSTTALTKD
ncbi:hypothetical protein [Streptomyces sediminimaris]|uniref:hypothetical protein n=1 Tax=Streptomyces sediminimaris TaxID=3383721 RepID=UPI00399AD1D4